MTPPGKHDTPPTDHGRDPDDVPGYAERQPRDRKAAQRPDPERKRDPEEGGLGREPEDSADPVKD